MKKETLDNVLKLERKIYHYEYFLKALDNDADTLRRQNKALNDKVERYKQCANDKNAIYSVRKTKDGRTAVCRISYAGGGFQFTLIKVFTDEDEEFNRNEAQELLDKLN